MNTPEGMNHIKSPGKQPELTAIPLDSATRFWGRVRGMEVGGTYHMYFISYNRY